MGLAYADSMRGTTQLDGIICPVKQEELINMEVVLFSFFG